MIRLLIVSILALSLVTPTDARGCRHRASRSSGCGVDVAVCVHPAAMAAPVQSSSADQADPECCDALAEVNAARAARGLRPYVRCEGLTAAAIHVARFRAARLCAGHTASDLAAVPAGYTAAAAGCAALHPSWGFQSCCQYEHWTFAGAAWVRGRDGRLYCQLFVR